MGEFFTILPPPQSVDTLDAWGSLDSLPFSLDSALWQTVGVYGLTVAEGGRSGESLSGANRVRSLVLAGHGKSGDEMNGEKAASIYEIAGEGQAQGGGLLSVSVLRGLEAVAAAKSGGVADVGRVLVVAGAGQSSSGEEVIVGFKGWAWDEKEKPSAPAWGQEMAEPSHWVHTQENAAEWAAQSVPAGGWTQKHGGVATWQ